jgi:predicted amidophosphoribosyltransferase
MPHHCSGCGDFIPPDEDLCEECAEPDEGCGMGEAVSLLLGAAIAAGAFAFALYWAFHV